MFTWEWKTYEKLYFVLMPGGENWLRYYKNYFVQCKKITSSNETFVLESILLNFSNLEKVIYYSFVKFDPRSKRPLFFYSLGSLYNNLFWLHFLSNLVTNLIATIRQAYKFLQFRQ